MRCPICENVDLLMSERCGVEIDYCPKCRGVWLDRGELDKIISASNTSASVSQQVPQSNIYDRGYAQNYHKPKKKESFFSELFDF